MKGRASGLEGVFLFRFKYRFKAQGLLYVLPVLSGCEGSFSY